MSARPPIRVPLPPSWADRLHAIGVTGTNGKTTTTTWIAAALATRAPCVRATTIGYFLGDEELTFAPSHAAFVDAMRAGIDRGAKYAALEMTSEALAQGAAKAWPVNVAVFTNLTHDHLDAHGTPEHYLASKAQLFVSLRTGCTAILNGSDEASALLEDVIPDGVRVWRYGAASRGAASCALDLAAANVDVTWAGTRVTFEAGETSGSSLAIPRELRLRAFGEMYAENAMAALLAAVASGIAPDVAANAIARAEPPPGRFEVVARKPYLVVDYAHSPDALLRTLSTARRLCDRDRGELWVVFGAGGHRDRAKRAPMGEAARIADHVVLTSDNPRDEDAAEIARAIGQGLVGHPRVTTELDRAAAIRFAVARAKENDVVLIAGKGHENEQWIGTVKRPFSDREVALASISR